MSDDGITGGRGINRQDIFEDDEDYLQMTSILRGQSERYDEKGLRLPPFITFYDHRNRDFLPDSRQLLA